MWCPTIPRRKREEVTFVDGLKGRMFLEELGDAIADGGCVQENPDVKNRRSLPSTRTGSGARIAKGRLGAHCFERRWVA
jgi:hypothetical protein